MNNLSCRQIENGIDDFIGGSLPEHLRIRFDMHLGTCERCRESIQLWRGFSRSMSEEQLDPYPPLVERRLVIAAVSERSPERKPKQTNWKVWTSLSAAAAAVAVIALFVTLSLETNVFTPADAPSGSVLVTTIEPGLEKSDDLSVTTKADGRQVIAVSPGTNLWLDNDAKVFVENVQKDQVRFRLEEGRVVAEVKAPVKGYRFVVVTPGGEVEAKGTVFSVKVDPGGVEQARVMRGVIEVRQTDSEDGKVLNSVLLQAGEESHVGDTEPRKATPSLLALDMCLVTACSKTDVTALEERAASEVGEVSQNLIPGDVDRQVGERQDVERQDGERHSDDGLGDANDDPDSPLVISGRSATSRKNTSSRQSLSNQRESIVVPEHSSAEHASQIQQIVSLAIAKRRAGLYPLAAEAYRKLIREYPSSAEARNALVSLGQLELVELGKPKDALSHFKEYLSRSPKGFLAEEARLGLVRATARLGQSALLIREASEYLYRHPGGYAGAEVLRLRGDAKRKSGDCPGAVSDYKQLKDWWPASRQNKQAAKGLAACGVTTGSE